MKLRFTKMHGLGNDFVVFDGVTQTVRLTSVQARAIADRRYGVGCDQILLVEPAVDHTADFSYRIFNADGAEVEQCGNGARCFARFVREQGLTEQARIRVATAAGVIELSVEPDGQVTVDMGKPRWEPAMIPLLAPAEADRYSITVDHNEYQIGAVSLGNPHAIVPVEAVAAAPVAWLGPLLESHPRFPLRVNVGFMEIVDRAHIRLRVFERGVGETPACGSGACAAVAVGRRWGWLDEVVRVDLPGGSLRIAWADAAAPIIMTGPAARVFEGWLEV